MLAIALAFLFGYSLTMGPVPRAGVGLRRAVRVAFAAGSVSITVMVMEIMDNAFILVVPGAIAAGLGDALFWWSLIVSLAVAFLITVPLNRILIARGRGHAVVHAYHHMSAP